MNDIELLHIRMKSSIRGGYVIRFTNSCLSRHYKLRTIILFVLNFACCITNTSVVLGADIEVFKETVFYQVYTVHLIKYISVIT